MRSTHVVLLVLLGVVLGFTVLDWVGRAQEAPPPEPTEVPLDRFERFTITNQSAGPVEFKELEFHLSSGATFDGDGLKIPPGTWQIRPGTDDQVMRIVFKYGQTGAEKWFEIKAHPGTKLVTGTAVVNGPDAGEVDVMGNDVKITAAETREDLGEKPPK